MSDSTPAPKKPATPAELDDAETITLTFEGFDFTIPASVDKWEAKTLKAFEENKAIVAVDRLLGARQSNALNNAFRDKHDRGMRVEDYGAVMELVAEAYGFESTGE